MSFIIKDKTLDDDIVKLQKWLQTTFNIKGCSKVDAIRYLLKMKNQGKKTNWRWKEAIEKDTKVKL